MGAVIDVFRSVNAAVLSPKKSDHHDLVLRR